MIREIDRNMKHSFKGRHSFVSLKKTQRRGMSSPRPPSPYSRIPLTNGSEDLLGQKLSWGLDGAPVFSSTEGTKGYWFAAWCNMCVKPPDTRRGKRKFGFTKLSNDGKNCWGIGPNKWKLLFWTKVALEYLYHFEDGVIMSLDTFKNTWHSENHIFYLLGTIWVLTLQYFQQIQVKIQNEHPLINLAFVSSK